MKNLLLILAVLFSTVFNSSAQNWRIWATYYGGTGDDIGYNLTTDPSGNVYITGQTASLGIAFGAAHQSVHGGGTYDAYLVKYNSSGVMQWATYYGGSGSDYGMAVKTDAAGNVYMTGNTSSPNNIATAGTHQTALAGMVDAYVVKFNSSGVRQWATYYGDAGYEQGEGVAIDATGNVYVTGFTESTSGFSTAGAHQMTNGGDADAFLVKFNSTGIRLWGTYYGGYVKDYGKDIVTDASGNVVICGFTGSPDSIASAGSHQSGFGGDNDAYVAKFNSSGTRLWATYYGGASVDFGIGIAKGLGDTLYLTGQTGSIDSIASGGFQNTYGGNRDAYLVKFNPAGIRVWGTYYGGAVTEEGVDVAVDVAGNVFIAGDTYSPNVGNCIATPGGFQTSLGGTENFYFVAFTTTGLRLGATYYGVAHEEEGRVALGAYGEAYLAGFTPSASGLSYNGSQNTFGGALDAILVKFTTSVLDTGIIVPNDTFPPPPPIVVTTNPIKVYASIELFNGGGITISNAILKNFSGGQPLPSSGSSIITCTCDFTGTYKSSSGNIPIECKGATLAMRVNFSSSSGPTRIYDTEMLQLNLSGGTLPAGVRIRESPTLQSLGSVSCTDIGGGEFRMASFFNVFTELSTDNGGSWMPTTIIGAPPRINLQDALHTTSVPTLSEWGLIALSVLVLFTGVYFAKSRFSA